MSVQVKLTSIKKLSNSSTASVVELSNFNFSTLTSAIKEFLTSINYVEGNSSVTVDIGAVAADLVTIRQGLSVYGTQLQDNAYPTVISLSPTGTVSAKNYIAEDVAEVKRLRIKVYGAIPAIGIPGEIIYIEGQGTYQEGIYVWLASSGWTLLSGGGSGSSACMQEVIMNMAANEVTTDDTLASDSLYLVPAPMPSSGFMFFVNGQLLPIGDGSKNAPAYLSNDDGVTAVLFNEADSTCRLYWNPSIAGFDLETSDNLTLRYFTIDPFCNQAGYSCNTQIANTGDSTTFQFGVEIISNGAASTPVTVCRSPNPTSNIGGDTLSPGFYLQNSILSFSITDWDDSYSGGAIVKFTVPTSMTSEDFSNLRIFHQDELGDLNDVTILAGDIVGDLYVPDFPNKWIYADVPNFSPFYLIVGVGETTTTSTSTTTTTTVPTTTTTTTCAPNSISYVTSYGTHPSQVTFYGTPTGPFYVTFVDQYSTEHDLTGLLGNQISLSWTFNVDNPLFSSIPSVVGVYTFTRAGGCQYEITIPVGSTTTTTTVPITTSSTTTTTTVPTTTTTTVSPTSTTSTTTTTTSLPPRTPRTTTTTTTASP